jgi:hypothetical protein
MRNTPAGVRLLAAFALFSASAFAANVTISTGGTFRAGDSTGPYSAPNGTWTLSFQVASQPVATNVTANQFTTTYTNGVFTLNGTPITLTGSSVTFVNSGSFNMLLDPANEFEDNTEVSLYSGSTSSPTIVPGVYQLAVAFIFAYPSQSPFYVSDPETGNVTITAASGTPTPSPTPLPPSVTLVLIGLAGLAIFEILRRRRSAA